MPRLQLVPMLLAAALVACSGGETAPRACAGPSDCPADARCRASVCVANGAPVAAVSAPASPDAFALVSLSGAASSDPDPEDGVSSYRWVVRSAGAPCPPPAVTGTSSTVQVRFGCAGAHEVELVVTDGLGAESAPAVVAVNVAPDPGPALVTAGPDVHVQHACGGTPVVCRAEVAGGAVELSSTGPTAAGITYAWIVQPPPGRDLGPGRRVIFTPGADAADPTVTIETDGLAISGDWVFRVEARDAAGPVGAAATRISIGNRAPAVEAVLDPVPHRYEPVAQRFEAAGALHLQITDPDGDPVTSRQVTAHRVNDGASSTFAASDVGDRITFSVVVPYDGPQAPGRLIGGEGLERTIRLALADANGAQVVETWGIVVENRPPALAAPITAVPVDHVYSAATQSYRATAAVSTWLDPDGDPLVIPIAAAPGSPPCTQPTLVGGTATVTCSLPFTGSPAADQLAGSHTVEHAVADPWTTSDPVLTTVVVLNRPPEFVKTTFIATGACQSESTCCEYDPDLGCQVRERTWGPGNAPSGTWLHDPDGDPLAVSFAPTDVTITPGNAVCAPESCNFSFGAPAQTACGFEQETLLASVTDGGPVVQAQLDLHRQCY